MNPWIIERTIHSNAHKGTLQCTKPQQSMDLVAKNGTEHPWGKWEDVPTVKFTPETESEQATGKCVFYSKHSK